MKIRIFALCLTALMFVAASATEAHAFGGPIERAVINWIRNARSNGGARIRRARPFQRVSALDVEQANPQVWG